MSNTQRGYIYIYTYIDLQLNLPGHSQNDNGNGKRQRQQWSRRVAIDWVVSTIWNQKNTNPRKLITDNENQLNKNCHTYY